MQNSLPSPSSRKKFLLWAAAAVGSAAVYKFNTKKKEIAKLDPEQSGEPMCQSKTVKMLTQDGTLVEIDRDLLASSGQKITNTELQNWVKK